MILKLMSIALQLRAASYWLLRLVLDRCKLRVEVVNEGRLWPLFRVLFSLVKAKTKRKGFSDLLSRVIKGVFLRLKTLFPPFSQTNNQKLAAEGPV